MNRVELIVVDFESMTIFVSGTELPLADVRIDGCSVGWHGIAAIVKQFPARQESARLRARGRKERELIAPNLESPNAKRFIEIMVRQIVKFGGNRDEAQSDAYVALARVASKYPNWETWDLPAIEQYARLRGRRPPTPSIDREVLSGLTYGDDETGSAGQEMYWHGDMMIERKKKNEKIR